MQGQLHACGKQLAQFNARIAAGHDSPQAPLGEVPPSSKIPNIIAPMSVLFACCTGLIMVIAAGMVCNKELVQKGWRPERGISNNM